MKKQTLVKLIVLGMIAAMLPISALAQDAAGVRAGNNCCVQETEEERRPANPNKGSNTSTSTTTPAETPAETPAVKVETTTTADGKTATATTVETTTTGTSSVATMTAEAVASLAEQAKDSEVVVLNVAASSSATEVAAEVPAAALADLATTTGADLTVSSAVADITISNADLAAIAGAGTNVSISAKVDGDTVTITVAVDGKAVEVAGGIAVSVKAKEGAVIYLVAEDGTETVIENVTFADGKASFVIPGNAKIRIG